MLSKTTTILNALAKKLWANKRNNSRSAKKQKTEALQKATTSVATEYFHLQNQTKEIGKHDKKNTVEEMIKATEHKYGLTNGLINNETVKTRVKMRKPSAFSHQKVSPVAEIEPILVQWCLLLAKMGRPLT
jgi:hypothetical protein